MDSMRTSFSQLKVRQNKVCKWGDTIPIKVTIPANFSYTGQQRKKIAQIDRCIASLVNALNLAGIRTDGSCCGHGKTPGWIVLNDGRMLTITQNSRESCSNG